MVQNIIELLKKSIAAYNEGGMWYLLKNSKQYVISSATVFNPHFPIINIKYNNKSISIGYRDKYLYDDGVPNVVPEQSDTVVEAGVSSGRDTAIFAKLADQVVGFEPSPRNYTRAKANLRKFDNISLHNAGFWNTKGELEIQYGESSGDDSFLTPDSDTGKTGGEVEVNTLENYVEDLNINEINFLKIEAEGAEPEIIEGMGELRPEKIVVNADEERDGESPVEEIMTSLQSKGYNLVAMSLGHVLFFVLDSDHHYAFRSEY